MGEFLNWVVGIFAAIIPGLGAPAPQHWSGYVEADYVYASAPTPGPIAAIAVREGDEVRAGEVLFTLSTNQQEAAVRSAEAQAASAEATWQNLTTGARVEELAASDALVTKAQTDFDLAQTTLARTQQLYASNTVPRAQLDQDAARAAAALAALDQARAQLGVLSLPAREAQQKAALAAYEVAKANAEKASADLADRTVTAPLDARVDRIYFDAGEFAAAGVPVVSLRPAGALKVKFYVGEVERHQLAVGDRVAVSCDGCPVGATASVSFLDSQPQNTPPIIYSRDERGRLVFLVEARMDGEGLLPGQPVSVERAE